MKLKSFIPYILLAGLSLTIIGCNQACEHKNVKIRYENIVDPTCVIDGSKDEVTYCVDCDKVLSTTAKVIPATGHTIVVDEGIDPTCTEPGLTEGAHCSVCDEILIEQEEIEPTGHTPVTDEGVAPTCDHSGLTEGSHCEECGEILVEQEEIEPTGHTIAIDKRVEPTCTEPGLTEGSHCSICGEVLIPQESIPATGHNYVIDKAVAPTCTEDGLSSGMHCDKCGDVLLPQEIVPKTGHTTIIDKAIAPTCTEDGLTEGSHCGVCGEILVKQQKIEKLGHNYVDTTGEFAKCTRCDSKIPLFHTMTDLMIRYCRNEYKEINLYANGTKELSKPNQIILTFDQLELTKTYSFTLNSTYGTKKYELTNNKIVLENLNTDCFYDYTITLADELVDSGLFKTAADFVRPIDIDGVTNVRDIGGKKTDDGKTIKQNLLYRCGSFNRNSSATFALTITEKGLKTALEDLKIKTEIDFRYTDIEAGYIGNKSALGDTVNLVKCPFNTTDLGFSDKDMVKKFFETAADINNYPMACHCSLGTDRTGFISALIYYVLGVNEATIFREYLFSNFANIGSSRGIGNLKVDGQIKTYPGANMQQKATNYLLDCGITMETINSFKDILLA